ncbi:DUF1800 domain-containing protein [Cellulophaga baltica]|uniref:Uncharacterized conserved protein, DUF1800 family n=1 Tax=Cellulophaga baltica TaxID=76594 RepID=A0A1G7DCG7_9FLAO|nr:DUF1800 domain-containing protein [Cellulophaga baltica]SDE48465.1 Uncharacterized conserved protein, DUF1800 family [Cellulophaga baltica]
MEYFINCNTAPLSPYTTPLDKQRAEHFYRRIGLSASVATIESAVGQTAESLVNAIINEATSMPESAAPIWADWTRADYPEDSETRNPIVNAQYEEWRQTYTRAILSNNLRDRLSFFWSNHFVTELRKYDAPTYLYHYTNCLQRNALGNFRTFTSEIGLDNAMLYYLDGVYNNGNNPNENYGRELYELFTLGEGNNYTEEDIIETARALTGYVDRPDIAWSPVNFDPTKFDDTPKTIFGQTANFDYDGVIDNLFTQRPNEISYFICKKLYEFFVHPDSTDQAGNAQAIIDGLAATFRANDFEIAPVLSQLFKSQHFFDDEAIGVIIKSPFDLFLSLINETSFSYTDSIIANMYSTSELLGQEVFNQPGVEGWYRNRQWINNNFMIGRWLSCEMFLELFYTADSEQFFNLAVSLVPNAVSVNNPDDITNALLAKLFPKGIAEDQLQNALDVFRDASLEQYYAPDGDGSWSVYNYADSAKQQLYFLLLHIIRQPEFQLK